MTEKRFWYDFEDCNGQKIVDFKEDKEYPLETIGDFRKIEDMLNEQYEQIEDLTDTNVRCCNEYSYFHKRMMELEKENQHIKTTIREAYKTERTAIGKNVLKQLLESLE